MTVRYNSVMRETIQNPDTGAVTADVCVYGGSAAGIMAAVQASRMGCSVALIAPETHLGGAMVEGLGSSDVDNHKDFKNSSALGGLSLDFFKRVGAAYGSANGLPVFRFESSVAEKVFDGFLREHKTLFVRRGVRLKRAEKRGTVLRTIEIDDGLRVSARVFIDSSIEGDLLHHAGVSSVIGREPNARYNETKNGIRGETTYRQFAVRVDPYRKEGNRRSGLIPTIQNGPLGKPGDGDRRIQAYCFRLCLTNAPKNRVPFEKPSGYDPADYEIYRRYARAGGVLWTPRANLPNQKTDMGSWHDLSANLYGMNHQYPGGSEAVRSRVLQEHLHFTQGLCWFLATDSDLPPTLRETWAAWGVCRDEFTDNNGWPRLFYVRDARRMVSDFVLTEHHTRRTRPEPVPDPVCVSFWPPDTHHVRRIVQNGAAYNEGFVFGGDDWGPFGVGFRALVPRARECTNLITPTCPSSSHVAYGAIRLEWTFMALGQAAGTAAALAVEAGVPVQKLPYARLRDRLLKDGQVLEVAPVWKA